jgi:hypothetical protein
MASITLPVAVLGAGALGVAGAGASALIGSNAAQTAAQDQLTAANNATNTELGIFNQTQANLKPYNQVGQSALSQLASLFGLGTGGAPGTGPTASTAAAATSALQNYPGYQFGLQQGNLAQQQSAASQGLLLSGSQLQAAQQYGQNYAMQNAWNPYVSQLSSLSGLGESAAANAATSGTTAANGIASSQLAAGAAAASGAIGSANAITQLGIAPGAYTGLSSALQSYQLQQAYNKQPITTTGYNFGVPSYSPYAGYPELGGTGNAAGS